MPFVTRLDNGLTKREVSHASGICADEADPGEWIAAGFNSEGMISAWLFGTALGLIVTQSKGC